MVYEAFNKLGKINQEAIHRALGEFGFTLVYKDIRPVSLTPELRDNEMWVSVWEAFRRFSEGPYILDSFGSDHTRRVGATMACDEAHPDLDLWSLMQGSVFKTNPLTMPLSYQEVLENWMVSPSVFRDKPTASYFDALRRIKSERDLCVFCPQEELMHRITGLRVMASECFEQLTRNSIC